MDVTEQTKDKSEIVSAILEQLADWFGSAEARESYTKAAKDETLLVCRIEGEVAGFLSLRDNTPAVAEIHSMGVLRDFHRLGAGRALVKTAEDRARADGKSFLSVKTLSSKSPDPHFAKTRAFYEGVGFLPFEELPVFWREDLPCLVLVKAL